MGRISLLVFLPAGLLDQEDPGDEGEPSHMIRNVGSMGSVDLLAYLAYLTYLTYQPLLWGGDGYIRSLVFTFR